MDRSVTVTSNGRSGGIAYREPAGTISFYWEFGGADVVATVWIGTENEWHTAHPWAVARRAEILRFVADELIRQQAPTCCAEIDDAGGWLHLRQQGAAPPRPSAPGSPATPVRRPPPPPIATQRVPPSPARQPASWVARYSRLRMALGVGVGLVALGVGGGAWLAGRALSIDPGKGSPVGDCARTGTHVAVLIQTLQPYVPSLNRDHSRDRYRLSIFLVPLDGSPPRLIPVASDLEPGQYSLARILGSDGRTLWFDAVGLHGVDERTGELIDAAALRAANPSLPAQWWDDPRGAEVAGRLRITARDRSQTLDIDPVTLRATSVPPQPGSTSPMTVLRSTPDPSTALAAGLQTSPTTWLGLHSAADLEGEFRPGRWVRRIEHADDAKIPRRLCRGDLEPASDGQRSRIISMTPIGDAEYVNAAFVRPDRESEPIRLSDPPGALMVWSSGPGPASTLMVGRVDDAGTLRWQVDTGIDRFSLRQILPSQGSTAFVGTRPPVPNKVSEPLLVIVEHGSGQARTVSLWR